MALEFFEPMLMSDEVLSWESDWSEFLCVLRNQFRPIDPTADAEDNMDNLRMKDNQRILRYNIEFTRLATQIGWNDSVLRHRYYSGLAEQIKDIMGSPFPTNQGLLTEPQVLLGTELTELGKLSTNRFFRVDRVKLSKTELSKLGTTRYHSVLLRVLITGCL